MKKLLFVLMLMPFLSNAQNDSKNNPLDERSDGKLTLVHADKNYKQPAERKENSPKKLKDDEVYTGNVQFKIGGNTITCDSAISYGNTTALLAFHVKITNSESFDITGNMLNYDKENSTAFLTDDITVTAKNGSVVGTSTNFKMDFSYEIYRITYGAITPLRDKQ